MATAAAAALAVLMVAVGLRFGLPLFADAGCAGQVKLTVAAAPAIAAEVRAAAQDLAAGQAAGNGQCVTVDVQAAESSDVAAAVSRQQKASLSGLGAASGTVAVPDVWISDSSTWLVRLRAAVPGFTVADQGSIALSPVLMAMPEPVAKAIGWPARKVTYGDLVAEVTTSTTLRAGTVEPTRDAVGLAGLLALNATAGKSLPAVLHALATGRSALRANLMQQFPQDSGDESIASSLGLAALSEQDVVAYNATSPAVPLAAVYTASAPVSMDFPFVVMPGGGPAQPAAAGALYQALRTPAAIDRLGRAGLRGPDGKSPETFTAPIGAPATVAAAPKAGKPAVNVTQINRALAGWSGVVAPARLLAVVDASKSTADPAGENGEDSRMQAMLEAARDGLTLFSDDWQVGLWEFDGGAYRRLVPIGPLINNRRDVVQALGTITPHGADTGLYQTILDAYRAVQDGWQAGRVNSVLVMTDGVAGPKQGDLALADLLAQLTAAKDPGRPVQVVIVGVGDAVARAPLDEITRTVGGGVFVAADPSEVGDVFAQAIALRVAVSR